jgi:hypothetical protein
VLGVALLLAGCTGSREQAPPPSLGPVGPSAAQIKSILAGKSWRWASPKNSGVTLYANDGTTLVEVDGKGTTTGTWRAQDGQLCESYAPAAFLPQGLPMTCQPFSGSGGTYSVGKATFTLA